MKKKTSSFKLLFLLNLGWSRDLIASDWHCACDNKNLSLSKCQKNNIFHVQVWDSLFKEQELIQKAEGYHLDKTGFTSTPTGAS